jgi:hypothetical protein
MEIKGQLEHLERLLAWCLGGENGRFCGLASFLGQKQPKSASDKPLSATNKPLSATNKPLSATEVPLSATNQRLSATNQRLSATKVPLFVREFVRKMVKNRQLALNWQVIERLESLVPLCRRIDRQDARNTKMKIIILTAKAQRPPSLFFQTGFHLCFNSILAVGNGGL